VRFTVTWSASAKNELATVWTGSSNRRAITAAVDSLERRLRNDPQELGEELDDNFRRVAEGPIQLLFEVSDADRLVTITRVARIGR